MRKITALTELSLAARLSDSMKRESGFSPGDSKPGLSASAIRPVTSICAILALPIAPKPPVSSITTDSVS